MLVVGYQFDHEHEEIYLTVGNRPRSTTAKRVEIYVLEAHPPPWNSPFSPGAMSAYNASIQRPLQWAEEYDDSSQQSIPSGFTRRCQFLAYEPLPSPEEPGKPEWYFSCNLAIRPQPKEMNFLWYGYPLEARIERFRRDPGEEEPATIWIAVAGENVSTSYYKVLVSYMPVKRGMYERRLAYTFTVKIKRSELPRTEWSGRKMRRAYWRDQFKTFIKNRPLPNESTIHRLSKRRRAGYRPDLSVSAIRREIGRRRGW